MATASIGGLASGLDTAAIIDQLMQLEAVPQTKLRSQVTSEQSKVSVLQSINAKLAALATAAEGLAAGTDSVWGSLQGSSTSGAVSVSASAAAQPTTLAVTVNATALTHRLAFVQAAALDTPGVVPTAVTITRGSETFDLTTDGTLSGLADAINAADAGVRATAVRTGTDSYRLLVESVATGAAQAFTVAETGTGADLLGGADVAAGQTGRDASVSVAGIVVTSAGNTFDEVVEGIDLTVAAGTSPGTTAVVTVTRDASARSAAVKGFVDAVNGVLDAIRTASAVSTDTSKSGVLAADAAVRQVATELVESIYPGDGSTMATFGIEVDRNGRLTFDAAAFATAFADDPAAVASAFTGGSGFAARVQAVAERGSDRFDGVVTQAINGRTETIERLNDSIDRWDDRLALRRTTLQRQYTALETVLSNLQSQSAWLAGQLASLSSSTE